MRGIKQRLQDLHDRRRSEVDRMLLLSVADDGEGLIRLSGVSDQQVWDERIVKIPLRGTVLMAVPMSAEPQRYKIEIWREGVLLTSWLGKPRDARGGDLVEVDLNSAIEWVEA